MGAGRLAVAAGTQGRPRGAGQCPAAAPRPPASRSHSCPVPPTQGRDPGDAINTAVQWGGFGKAGICGELPGKSSFHVGAASAPPPRAARSPGTPISTGEQRHGPAPAVQAEEKVMDTGGAGGSRCLGEVVGRLEGGRMERGQRDACWAAWEAVGC